MAKDNQIQIPADAVPALETVANELSGRLGRQLNFAQAYLALCSAEQAQAIQQDQWRQNPADPLMLDTVAKLLLQEPELLEELLQSPGLQNPEKKQG